MQEIFDFVSARNRASVDGFLLNLGFSCRLLGFIYLGDALELMKEKGIGKSAGIAWIYAILSDRHRVSMQSIERAMRYAIEEAFTKGNAERLNELFPRDFFLTGKPSNLEFLARVAREIPEILV